MSDIIAKYKKDIHSHVQDGSRYERALQDYILTTMGGYDDLEETWVDNSLDMEIYEDLVAKMVKAYGEAAYLNGLMVAMEVADEPN